MSVAPRTPKGWYPDPTGRHAQRWWDGRAWAVAVADGEVRSGDADGLVPGAPRVAAAAPSGEDRLEVLRSCGVAALGATGPDPMEAPVLMLWRRRQGRVDVWPEWSVHDGAGGWFGTFRLEVGGPGPNDRRFVLRAPDATARLWVGPARPRAVATVTDHTGERAAVTNPDGTVQRLQVEVEGMTVARVSYSVGEVGVHDLTGEAIGRLVPPSLRLRAAVGGRCGWDPVLVSERLVSDPVSARAVDALALAWEHVLREWVAS
ncbi:MAG: DUF2510 domain-containing protein [Microthrixaceae bacterium]